MGTRKIVDRQRITLSEAVTTRLLVKSKRRCCLCFGINDDATEKEGQIAHLDDDPSNNSDDNLAWLCLRHHSLKDTTTSQHKNYTIGEVKHYRAQLYEHLVKEERKARERIAWQEESERKNAEHHAEMMRRIAENSVEFSRKFNEQQLDIDKAFVQRRYGR